MDIAPRKRHNEPLPRETKELCKALYLQGVPPTAISGQTGVKVATLNRWITRGSWVAMRHTANGLLAANGHKTLMVGIASDLINRSNKARQALATEVEAQIDVLAKKSPKSIKELAGRNGRSAVLKTVVEAASAIYDWSDTGTKGLIVIGDMDEVERLRNQQPVIELEPSSDAATA